VEASPSVEVLACPSEAAIAAAVSGTQKPASDGKAASTGSEQSKEPIELACRVLGNLFPGLLLLLFKEDVVRMCLNRH
jgi:hypothetical protein